MTRRLQLWWQPFTFLLWMIAMTGMFPLILGNPSLSQSLADGKYTKGFEDLRFLIEPPLTMEFSNSTGTQIECKAYGQPVPKIQWETSDGISIKNIPGLRHVTVDGLLVFQPFQAENYRQDIHAVNYRCSASNSKGTIVSQNVQVKAVTVQPYEVYVYDVYIIKGNDAVIKCHVPNFLVNYIDITNWLRDDRYIINNTDFNEDNKYVLLPGGSLLIRNVDQDDHESSYECRTINRLTKMSKISSTKGKLFVTEPQINIPPKIIVSKDNVRAREGETLVLPCVVQGNPIPQVIWMRIIEGKMSLVETIVHSGTLIIDSVERKDSGQYRCSAKNSVGEVVKDTYITIDVPLSTKISPSEITSKLDQRVTLSCEISGNPIDLFYWLKDGKTISKDDELTIHHRSLTIHRMKPKHKGIYQCFAVNKLESVHSEAFVNLRDLPPELLDIFSEQTLEQGDSLSIRCKASGTPNPVITWMLDNNKLTRNNYSQTLSDGSIISWVNITSVRMENGGIYTCIANNKAGNAFYTARINVDGPLVARSQSVVRGISGEKIQLHCPVYGYPIQSIKWFKDEIQLPLNNRQTDWENGTLTLEKLQKHGDTGNYQCMAENLKGEKAVGTVQLAVLVPPKIVPFSFQEDLIREGMRARIQCVVSEGDLPLTIEWTKDNEPLNGQLGVTIRDLDEFSSILTISSVSPRHNGEYTCRASNGASTTRFSARLSVNVPPKIIGFSFQDDQFFKGMRAHIICAVSQGDLPIEFMWVKDGQSIPPELGVVTRNIDGHANSLSIESVSSLHTGNYTCIASNAAAKVSHMAQLLVYVAPKITPFSFQEESTTEGSFARVTCLVYQGDLPIILEWLKDNKVLTNDDSGVSIRIIDEYSSILTIERVEQKHSGNYTCLAKNAAASVDHTARLLVHGNYFDCSFFFFTVPPKIVPFAFQEDHLLEGMLVRVSCVVSRGDLPLSITWLKDSRTIPTELSVAVRDFDEFSSVLSIDPVKIEHSGNYTCLAKNHAGTDTYTAILKIYVPARWRIIPSDQIAVKKSSLTIDCQAEGFPLPKITWAKELGKRITDEGKFISASPYISLLSNGSLHFQSISLQDQGYYYCSGNNGIGAELNRRIYIKVQAPVHFKRTGISISTKVGSTISLACEAFGDVPIEFSWFHENTKISTTVNQKYEIKIQNNSNTEESASSNLSIKSVTVEDGGKYICTGSNSYGNASTVTKLIIQVPPSTPDKITIKNTGNRTVQVGWMQPHNGNSIIKKYILQYKRKQDSWTARAKHVTLDSFTRTTTIKDLQPATIYEFRIAAENDVGRGNFSEVVTILLGEEAPDGSPLNVEVEAVDPQTLRISWKPPKKSLWNGVIRGYYIGYKIHESSEDYTFKNLEVPEDYVDDILYQLKDLQMFTKYSIIIQAYNTGGRGPNSPEIVAMTSEDIPSEPPQEIRCSSLSSRSIYVIWKPPPSEAIHGILKGYKIIYKSIGVWQNNKVYSNISVIPKITLNNLEVDANYSIQVLAFTKLGEGVKSRPVFCKTYEDVPSSPEAIKALPLSEETILVSWKSPSKSSGTVTKYNIYYTSVEDSDEHKDFSNKQLEGVSVVTVETEDKNHVITDLIGSKRYAFWVTAISSIGEGPMSTVVITQPSKGRNVPAEIASFDDNIKTQWKKNIILPCMAVGTPFPDRKWFHRGELIHEDDRIFTRNDGALVIKKSVIEDGGDYSCEVSNEFGKDKVHYSISVIVPPGIPVLDVLSKTLTSIRLRWSLENDGGSSIQGYNLYYQRQSDKWEKKEFTPEIETTALENLACGATYQIYLEAYNEIGIGKPCDIVTVTTYGEVFQVPSKEHLIQEGGTFITVHLEAWPSGGCPIQYFVAEYKQLTASEWRLVSNRIQPTQKKLVIPGLIPATWYIFRLTAYTSGEDLNIAEYVFGTLTIGGGTLPPHIHPPEERVVMFYLDPWIFIPIIAILIIIIIISVSVFIYCKRRTHRREQPMDWTQYAGTLARTRELGMSVESFVPFQKPVTNIPINDYETLNKGNYGVNPYSTTHVPVYNSEMTLRRGRTPADGASRVHSQLSKYGREQDGLQNDDKTSTNPFLNPCAFPNEKISQNYGECYDIHPVKTQDPSFININGCDSGNKSNLMESVA